MERPYRSQNLRVMSFELNTSLIQNSLIQNSLLPSAFCLINGSSAQSTPV
jgi:hypothetical protein